MKSSPAEPCEDVQVFTGINRLFIGYQGEVLLLSRFTSVPAMSEM